jgi:hypothetical protein
MGAMGTMGQERWDSDVSRCQTTGGTAAYVIGAVPVPPVVPNQLQRPKREVVPSVPRPTSLPSPAELRAPRRPKSAPAAPEPWPPARW